MTDLDAMQTELERWGKQALTLGFNTLNMIHLMHSMMESGVDEQSLSLLAQFEEQTGMVAEVAELQHGLVKSIKTRIVGGEFYATPKISKMPHFTIVGDDA